MKWLMIMTVLSLSMYAFDRAPRPDEKHHSLSSILRTPRSKQEKTIHLSSEHIEVDTSTISTTSQEDNAELNRSSKTVEPQEMNISKQPEQHVKSTKTTKRCRLLRFLCCRCGQ